MSRDGDSSAGDVPAERAAWLAKAQNGQLRTPADTFAAGVALLGGATIAEVETAQRLLLSVMATEPRARPLAAAAYDRLRLLRGLPQKFGTQWVERDGAMELWDVDPATTDSERCKWGLPGLSGLRRRGGS